MMVTDDFLLLKILTIYAIGLSSAKFQHFYDDCSKPFLVAHGNEKGKAKQPDMRKYSLSCDNF